MHGMKTANRMRTVKNEAFRAVALTALLYGLQAGCARTEAATESRQPVRSGPLTVSRDDFSSVMLLTGELQAADAVRMTAPNANVWPLTVRWVAEDGIEVKEDAVVVEFDSSQLLANLDDMVIRALEAESELESVQARVASEIEEAELELERKKAEAAKARLDAEVPEKLRSGRDYERSQLELKRADLQLEGAVRRLDNARESGRSDVEIQRIALVKASNEVRRAEASVDKLTLRAQRDGILLIGENFREGRPVKPGDTVWPGMIVAQLPDLETLEVEARLFDVDDERVKVDQPVHARLDAFPDREYTGRVREVDDMANQAGRRSLRRFFNVKIALDDVDPEIMRPGMSVKVVIGKTPLENVLVVPRAALDWSAGEPRARFADGTLKPVELGPCNAFDCVVEGGLEEGQELGKAAEVLR